MPDATEQPRPSWSRRAVAAAGLGLAIGRPAWAAPPVGCGTLPCAFGPTTSWAAARAGLDGILTKSLLPFWRRVANETKQAKAEGYDLNHDLAGRWLGPSNRAVVTQARMLWFFAHLRRHGRATKADTALAERGVAILGDRFWDPVHGGFFWEVRHTSYAPTKLDKQLYGQAFALFALCEHALTARTLAASAASVARATALAHATFAVIDARFRDAAAGNYREFLLRDFSAAPASRHTYLAALAGQRSHNTRIHLLEALTTYHELARTPAAAARLAEVTALTEAALVRAPAFYFREIDGLAPTRQSYGHDLETIHLLMRARAQLGRCGAPPSFYGSVVDDALRLGQDAKFGGVFTSGPAGAAADERTHADWIQAEALLTLAELCRLTGEAGRMAAFLRTLDWVGSWQVDWAKLSWYPKLDGNRRPSGAKAGPWGGPYHTGRAVLGCIRLIDAITSGAPKGGCTPI